MGDDLDEKIGLEYVPVRHTRENYPYPEYESRNNNRSSSSRELVSSGKESKSPGRYLFSPSQGNRETRHIHESPQDLDIDCGYSNDVLASTYALQVALKNMKERYTKLQKKITVLEDENNRLISGKSELFGEIGKMQESSIKLREKNLELNYEVHNKHKECCSLKEQFSALSEENLKLTSKLMQASSENKKLMKQVAELDFENTDLRENIEEMLHRCRNIPGITSEHLSYLEEIAQRPKSLTVVHRARDTNKIKIVPSADDISTEFEKYDNVLSNTSSCEDCFSLTESYVWDMTKDVESLSVDAFFKGKESMKKMAAMLQKQQEALLSIKPFIQSISRENSEIEEKNKAGKANGNFVSTFATCDSSVNPSTLIYSEDNNGISPTINDSGGATNVLVEERIESGRRSPFDWRKVEVSDDDVNESSSPAHRPPMRTVSTSPDLTMTLELARRRSEERRVDHQDDDDDDDDRTCPMCNAVFPPFLPQETFEAHVVSHFEVENGFEVIT